MSKGSWGHFLSLKTEQKPENCILFNYNVYQILTFKSPWDSVKMQVLTQGV